MTTNLLARSLDGITLLDQIPPADLNRLSERCKWQHYEQGMQILGHMDRSEGICFVVQGKARVVIYSVSGKSVTFRDIAAGDMFGELSAIDGQERSASVEALEPCTIATLSPELFREVLQIYPAVSAALLQRLTAQVRHLTERVFEFSTLAVKNRIHAELLRLARKTPHDNGQAWISPAPTHAEIASRISTHREAVTRELNHLAHSGLIERKDGKLLILNVSQLSKLVQEVTGH
ncbi:MAG: Crp/Fnr family transcriptional regulator [Pseudomonadota bacterium]